MSNKILKAKELLSYLGVNVGAKVGDFGSGGSGIFTIPIAKIVGLDGMVYALDLSQRALSALISKAHLYNIRNITPIHTDIENENQIVLFDESLDHALLINVLHYSSNPNKILKNILRLLKLGGTFLVVNYSIRGARMFGVNCFYKASDCELLLHNLPFQKDINHLDLGELYYGYLIRKI